MSTDFAKFIWLYAVIPYLGAVLAALLYIYHNAQESSDRKDKGLPPTAFRKRREDHIENMQQRRQHMQQPQYSNLQGMLAPGQNNMNLTQSNIMAPNVPITGNYVPPFQYQ